MLSSDWQEKCWFEIRLTEARASGDGSVELSYDDVAGFRDVAPIVKALRAVLGKHEVHFTLKGAVLRVEFKHDESLKNFANESQSLYRAFMRTADEVKKNAQNPTPLPHVEVVTMPHFVPPLQAVANANHRCGITVALVTDDGKKVLPVLDVAEFIQPIDPVAMEKCGQFEVVGIRRDDNRGHRLLVSQNEIDVWLSPDEPRWSWSNIRDALDSETWLAGTLSYDVEKRRWTLAGDARLVVQKDLLS